MGPPFSPLQFVPIKGQGGAVHSPLFLGLVTPPPQRPNPCALVPWHSQGWEGLRAPQLELGFCVLWERAHVGGPPTSSSQGPLCCHGPDGTLQPGTGQFLGREELLAGGGYTCS